MTQHVKIIVIAVAALVVVLVVYGVYTFVEEPGNATSQVPSSFTVNGRSYDFTYTATTPAERAAGLMNTRVTNTTTMLFAFPSSGQWSFWMYDTNTSLDIIWVSATGNSGHVVYAVTSAQPCYNSGACTVYTPTAEANFVIEAKAGFAAANEIAVGADIQFG
ncbi:MAG: DUF192 domain-containing protein [Thaumarchaeota archaeon]|nr:DUF192 domain-containing protein [Nitrososphaerota archaeon]